MLIVAVIGLPIVPAYPAGVSFIFHGKVKRTAHSQ